LHGRSDVGFSRKRPFVNGCQNPRKDGAAEKVGMAFALTSTAPFRRNLGGKRGLGGKPWQAPVKAVSRRRPVFTGLTTQPYSATEVDG
jgi:hypothetical protein